jgi:hypothetical protein
MWVKTGQEDGRGGRKGKDKRWLKMGHLSLRWEQTGYKKVDKDRTEEAL